MSSFPYAEAFPVRTRTTAAETIEKGNGVVAEASGSVFIAAERVITVANTDAVVSCWAAPMLIRGAPKESGTGRAWADGDKLYWDEAGQRWSDDATGNIIAGIAAADAAAAATTGDVIYVGPQLVA